MDRLISDIWVQYGALGILIAVLVWIMLKREADLRDTHQHTKALLDDCKTEKQLCFEDVRKMIREHEARVDAITQSFQNVLLNVVQEQGKNIQELARKVEKCQLLNSKD